MELSANHVENHCVNLMAKSLSWCLQMPLTQLKPETNTFLVFVFIKGFYLSIVLQYFYQRKCGTNKKHVLSLINTGTRFSENSKVTGYLQHTRPCFSIKFAKNINCSQYFSKLRKLEFAVDDYIVHEMFETISQTLQEIWCISDPLITSCVQNPWLMSTKLWIWENFINWAKTLCRESCHMWQPHREKDHCQVTFSSWQIA